MRILITAGGTSEKIDQVRSITNHSTGRLGQTLAEHLANKPENTIDYVTTTHAIHPNAKENIHIHLIESTQELFSTLESLLKQQTYDAIIHSMAVSDFTPAFSLSEEQFVDRFPLEKTPDAFSEWVTENETLSDAQSKISSDTDHLVLVLKKTPKIIQFLRKWQPDAKIVGFKLLVDVPKEQLLAVAEKSLRTNQTDFIFANDLTEIHGDHHHGYLLFADGTIKEAQTKKEIAELIAKNLS